MIMASETELAALQQALNALSLAPRTVFMLHRVDGLDFVQIAWRLGLSVDAVERHFADAMWQITFGDRQSNGR
jgi:DNA-directed RNA polymerase specialized sigma24 family protein